MDFYHFFSSSKDFTFDFSMSHCYTRYRSEEISPGEEPFSRRAAEGEARPGLLFLPTDPQNQHRVQKISSMWFDFSPFCLRWTSRQSVFVFSGWTRVGGGFERSGSRTGFPCFPSSPYTSPDDLEFITTPLDWRGGRRSTNRKNTFCRSSILMHMFVSGRESTGVIPGKELAQLSAGVHGPDCPQRPPPLHGFMRRKFQTW